MSGSEKTDSEPETADVEMTLTDSVDLSIANMPETPKKIRKAIQVGLSLVFFNC